MLYVCRECGWFGEHLIPTFIPGLGRLKLKTFACPVCGSIVGDKVTGHNIIEETPEEAIEPVVGYLSCRYCGKQCKSRLGKLSHERACVKKYS